MDPLSIALAAISLATAVKDLAELAQKLERSFSKPSENFRNAEMLATEIRQTVDELKSFCDEHEEILSNANDMKLSLLELIRDMKSVYDNCCGIAPVTSKRKINKFMAAFGAWMNRNKVESDIRELMNRVNKCHTRFIMFSIVRIEKRLLISSNANTQGSSVIRTEITNKRVSDERIIGFVGTSSATLSTLPPEISADFISDAYLRLQIHAINTLMEKVSSTASYPVEEPKGNYLLPFRTFPGILVVEDDRIILRQDVITQALQIQTILQGGPASLSVQTGAGALAKLASDLFDLDMYHESALIGAWTVKLFRTLVTNHPTTYSPHLALSLSDLALACGGLRDVNGARSAISECIAVVRSLQIQSASFDIKLLLPHALSISASVSLMEGEPLKSLQEAEEAVLFFDNVVARSNPTNGTLQIDRKSAQVLGNSSSSATHRHAQALHQLSPSSAVYDCARALRRFSISLKEVGRFEEAFQTQLRVLENLDFLAPFYPDRLDLVRARMLDWISHPDFRGFLPANDALPMSQESVAIFREYFKKDRQKYGIELCDALWNNAFLLVEMKRYDDALPVWREVAGLVQTVEEDRLRFVRALDRVSDALRFLERHDEAAMSRRELVNVYQSIHKSAPFSEAYAYYDLAYDLQLAGRYPEAIREAQTSVMHYRTLAFKDPSQYTEYLAKGLHLLSDTLFDADEYEQAFHESHEALDLYHSLIRDDSSVLSDYVDCIRLNMRISRFSGNETKSIERGQIVIHHSNELVKRFPKEREQTLIYATYIHSFNLRRFDRLAEASVAIQGALDWYENAPVVTPLEVGLHMDCFQQMALALDAQGYLERALGAFEKAIDIGKEFSSHPDIVRSLAWTMSNRADSLFDVGRYSEAFTAGQDAVAVIRGTDFPDTFGLVWCLQVSSMVKQYNGKTEAAIEDLQEAIKLSRNGIIAAKDLITRSDHLVDLSEGLRSLSAARADAGNEVEALSLAQEGLDEVMKLKLTNAILPWTDIQSMRSIHMDALHNLSLRLASNNDLSRALELIVEASVDYEQRAQARSGLFPDFAWILLSQGVLYCAAGRHEEGIVARTKLSDIQKRLGLAFPSLARWVQVKLDRERDRPSWIALIAKLDLQCNHQDLDAEAAAPVE